MKVDKARGMNVSVVTTAKTDEEARSSSSSSGCRSGRVKDEVQDHLWPRPRRSRKTLKTPKFKVRLRNRCRLCGRPRAYMRKFALCRLCFRKLALEGDVTGVTKSSW